MGPDASRHSANLIASPVLITGASGFLGGHVCRTFIAKGYAVRALVRDASRAQEGTEVAVASDLLDRQAIRRALAGVGTVVHLAARVHVMDERATEAGAAYRRTNVSGTRVLVEEAAAAGVPRFVFISSVKAVGESSQTPWTEETPPAPVDPYGRSKLEAEAVVRELARGAGMHASTLRLPLVYGPRMKGNMLRLFKAVHRGWPLPLGDISNRRSLVFSGNVTAAIEAVAAAPRAADGTFFVSDGDGVSTSDLVRAIGVALGRPPRLVRVPPVVFRAAGLLGDGIARVMPWPLTTAALDRLLGSLEVDSSRIQAVAGFQPPFTLRGGLRETAAWFVSSGAKGGRMQT